MPADAGKITISRSRGGYKRWKAERQALRARRLDIYHRPYHNAITARIDRLQEDGQTPRLVSIHSFTPQLLGNPPRPWHIGVLWDRDARLVTPLLESLRREPDLVVGDNEPYIGRLADDCMYRHGTLRMARGWCFAAGLPVGALAGLAFAPGGAPASLAWGSLAGAVALAGIGRALTRSGAGSGVASAAQTGWLALPAAGCAWLGVGPGPGVGLALVTALLVCALFLLRERRVGPPLLVALFCLVIGDLGWAGLGAAVASRGAAPPSLGEETAAAIYDLDARVVTRPLPVCGTGEARVDSLLERGAHPRLAAEGTTLWFDAATDTGQRQVHRLDLESGAVACVTCDEAGNNRRPAPSERGRAIVFDSDRFAGLADPANTELFHMRIRDGDAPHPSRRLTFHAGRDDHAVVAPGGSSLLWSRHDGGRFSVVSATFRTGHGALLLAEPREVVAGGSAWAAPLAWSSDARALVSGRGNPFSGLRAEQLDPATGAVAELGDAVRGAAFSADGGRIAQVAGEAAGGMGGLPDAAGFLLGALPAAAAGPGAGGGTRLSIAETGRAPQEVDLGEAAVWGSPTGVASSPDGTWLVLGQRRVEEGIARERLVRVGLDCTLP